MKMKRLRHTALRIFIIMAAVFAINVGLIHISSSYATGHTIERGSSFVIGNLRYFRLSDDPNGVAVAWGRNTDIDTLFTTSESFETVTESEITSSSWALDIGSTITHSVISEEVEESSEPELEGGLQVLAVGEEVVYVNKTFTVKAVAPSGFRYCTFSSITLPQTIDEIGKEAFYCCQNLKEIQLPKNLTAISDSCFMDCRKLEHVYYSDSESGARTNTNSLITSVGNHAFANCVSLIGFNCPTNLVSIGHAAFQKCSKMMSFFFPSKIMDGDGLTITNKITVGDYAFSDCSAMTLCYFEENLTSVGKYAFAQCDKLMLYYTGSSIPDLGTFWRKKHVATDKTVDHAASSNSGGVSVWVPGQLSDDYVPININNGEIKGDDRYPGLFFTIQTTPIKINCTTTQNIDLEPYSTPYASVFKFDMPEGTTEEYYDATGKALKIPATVKVGDTNYDLKVIQSNAFALHDELKSLSFASDSALVQICHHAFVGCTNLATINFANATNLKEISYQVFQADTTDVNEALTEGTLAMPANLKYLGYRAFYNFKKAPALSLNDGLQFIGESAFENFGASISGSGTCNLTIPYTLNDSAASTVQPYKTSEKNYDYAIMENAFKNAKALKTVKIDVRINPEDLSDNDWTQNEVFYQNSANRMSINAGAFSNCGSLLRFQSGPRLFRMYDAVFGGSTNLKELFITGLCPSKNDTDRPWSKDSKTIFGSHSFPDLVIYVKENDDPNGEGTPFGDEGQMWNSDLGLVNTFASNNDKLYRKNVPTYYGVDWTNPGSISYAQLEKNSDTYQIKSGYPLTSTDFSSDVVSYIPNGDTDGNIITHCYVKDNREKIDLSTNDFSAGVIGKSAFTNGTKYPGKHIKLPKGVTQILDRAFYRTNNNGVSQIQTSTGTLVNNGTSCSLPALKKIEKLAFYNNQFTSISITSGNLDFFGNTIFAKEQGNATIESIKAYDASGNEVASGVISDNFKIISNGIYYTDNSGNPLTLLYQANKGTGTGTGEPAIKIADGTIAIGAKAFVRSNYKTVTIPNSLTTIYGTAFGGSRNGSTEFPNNSLVEVKFESSPSLQYIGGTIQLSNSDAAHYDVLDGGYYLQNSYGRHIPTGSTFGPFYSCKALTTFDFTAVAGSLKKITYGAFQACSNLQYMTGSKKTKEYYRYETGTSDSFTWGSQTQVTPGGTGNQYVLDLSECTNLTSVSRYAFGECSLIRYVHLPEFTLLEEDPSNYRMGYDNDADYLSWSKQYPGGSNVFNSISSNFTPKIFVGEKACVAHWNGGSQSNLNNQQRYPAARAFPNNASYVYFYVDGAVSGVDTWEGKDENTRYWTKKDGKYILFDGKSGKKPYKEVQQYFGS